MTDSLRQLPDALLERQRQAWLAGERPSIDELLAGTPFQNDREAQLDLLYNEVVVLEELGETPSADDYFRRYPHLKHDLELHFEIHRAVNEKVLLETAGVADRRSWPEGPARTAVPVLPALQDYEVGRLLGQGGMADVYHARHRRLKRDVALKLFQPSRFLTSRESFRIRNEAEAMARLAHPNIIQIFEVGEREGAPYLALELAAQGTLAQKLQRFPFTPRAAAELIETLARGIEHAHARQVIHRDLKPANVLFTTEGVVKITDFGLAKVSNEKEQTRADATRTGEALGTPRYMAPEQAAGEHDRVGVTTDVYALGTLLYECLTGQAPFVATSVADTLQKIRFDDPLAPRRLQPALPRDLETICLQCLQKAPERRYASAGALAGDLRRFLDGKPIEARATPGWERLVKWVRRKPAQGALVLMGALLVTGALAAAIILPQLENHRLSELRSEVATLMKQGRAALDRDEPEAAEARFQSAWRIVRGEPALADHETSVAGWLDHSRNQANRYQWKQRVPPRDYDDRRDEALLLSLCLVPGEEKPIATARDAIAAALELTLPGERAWELEREQLVLLEAEMRARESGAEGALAWLDGTNEFASRRFHARRAEWLDRAGRAGDAAAARAEADKHPHRPSAELFQAAMDLLREQQFAEALAKLEALLTIEPEHFTARLFQALCFLHLDRYGEARVALTACIAQRPLFHWSYFYRSQAEMAAGDRPAALRDLERSTEGRPSVAMRRAAQGQLKELSTK